MMRHRNRAGFALAGILLALVLALAAGDTLAAYTTRLGGAATAQVAEFDVEITAPEGIDAGEILYTLPGTEYEYEFWVTNHSQVTVQCTVTCTGQSLPVYSVWPQSLVLQPGESQPIVLMLTSAGPSALDIVQDLDFSITCEQVD